MVKGFDRSLTIVNYKHNNLPLYEEQTNMIMERNQGKSFIAEYYRTFVVNIIFLISVLS